MNVPRLSLEPETPESVIRWSTSREAAVGIVGVPERSPYAPDVATVASEDVADFVSSEVSRSCNAPLIVSLSAMVEPLNVPRSSLAAATPLSVMMWSTSKSAFVVAAGVFVKFD